MLEIVVQFLATVAITLVAVGIGAYYLLLSPPAPVCEVRGATNGKRIEGGQEGEEVEGVGEGGGVVKDTEGLGQANAHVTVQHALRSTTGSTLSVRSDYTCRLDESAEWVNELLHYAITSLIASSAASVEARQQHRLEILEQRQLQLQQQQQLNSAIQNAQPQAARLASVVGSRIASPNIVPQIQLQSPGSMPQHFSLSGHVAPQQLPSPPSTTTDAIMALKLKEMASSVPTVPSALLTTMATPHKRTTSTSLSPAHNSATGPTLRQPVPVVPLPPTIPKDRLLAEVLVAPLVWSASSIVRRIATTLRATTFKGAFDDSEQSATDNTNKGTSRRSGGFGLTLNSFSLGPSGRVRIDRPGSSLTDGLTTPTGGPLGALLASQLPEFVSKESTAKPSASTNQLSPSASNAMETGARPTSPMLLPDNQFGRRSRASPVPEDTSSPPRAPSPIAATDLQLQGPPPQPIPADLPLSTEAIACPFLSRVGARYALVKSRFTTAELSSCNHASLEVFEGPAVDRQRPMYFTLPLRYSDQMFKLDVRATSIPLLFFLNKPGTTPKVATVATKAPAATPLPPLASKVDLFANLKGRRIGTSESGASSSVASYAAPFAGTLPVVGGMSAALHSPAATVPRPLATSACRDRRPPFNILSDFITMNCGVCISGLSLIANVDVRVRILDGAAQLATEMAEAPCHSYAKKGLQPSGGLPVPALGLSEGAARLLRPTIVAASLPAPHGGALSAKIAARANFLAAASLAPRQHLAVPQPPNVSMDSLMSTPPANHLSLSKSSHGSPNPSHCLTIAASQLPAHHAKAQAALEAYVAKLVGTFGLTHKLLAIEITCRQRPTIDCEIATTVGGREHSRNVGASTRPPRDATKAAEVVRLAMDKALADSITYPTAIQVCLGRRAKQQGGPAAPSDEAPPIAPLKIASVARKVHLSSW